MGTTDPPAYVLRSRGGHTAFRFRSILHGDPSTHPLTIVVADDHDGMRRGIVALLEPEADLAVVAEAEDLDGARRTVRELRPDVLLLDLNMPGGSSLASIPSILADAAATAIIVLTMQDEPGFVARALEAGARGYVLKETADAELVDAVRQAAAGVTYVSQELRERIVRGPSATR